MSVNVYPLDTSSIIVELEAERERLNSAIEALQGSTGIRRAAGRKRHLSAAARKKISEAQKARWAKQKKAA